MNTQPTPSVGFVEATRLYFQNATNFSGRARRSEYWMAALAVALINFAVSFVTTLLAGLLGEAGALIGGLATLVWGIYCTIASLSICIRRLHDIGKSGWFCLLFFVPFGGIVMLVFACQDSGVDNQWGPNPKYVSRQAEIVVNSLPSQPAIPSYSMTDECPPTAPLVAPPASIPSSLPHLQGVLQIQTGPMAGQTFRYPEGTMITLGRNPAQCDLVLTPYKKVSGVHCKLHFGSRVISILDANSTNGTAVNGQRLASGQSTAIRDRAVLHLASAECTMNLWFE